MDEKQIAIGGAAGGSGDRVDAARPVVDELIRRGGAAALTFENLAERTLAFAHLAKRANPESGYESLMEMEVAPVLADCMAHGIPIISNFGAANPPAAARRLKAMAASMGLPVPRIAVIEGDDLSSEVGKAILLPLLPPAWQRRSFVSANVYIGAFAIAEALRQGAQIVVAGRVADPALALGAAIAHYGWGRDDLDALAGATMAGHLIECGAQVTGGYFADPGFKDVPDLHRVGFPIVTVARDGSCVLTKPEGTGGLVDVRTVKEQLLYEIHDPAAYLTPDVVADITQATVEEIAPGQVRLSGVRGHARPPTLKAGVYVEGGWIGEGEISYAGPNAQARARLAMDVLQKRMGEDMPIRFDLIGVLSVHGDPRGALLAQPSDAAHADIRVRAAIRHHDLAEIERLQREFTGLWLGGPSGGGGVKTSRRQRLESISCLVPREQIHESFYFAE
ncbi:MAG: acyclic terpene utilization AtuA family protein [Pseudomonadota bacterium]